MHHLFSLGGTAKQDSIPSQQEHVSPPSGGDQSIVIRLGSHCFSLPQSVTTKTAFQRSRLGLALNSSKSSQFDLPDGTVITRISAGELEIERPEKAGCDRAGDFALLVDHLLGRKPLETFGFSTIADAYKRLLAEVRFWGIGKLPVELPYRLWTRSRWSDLAGVYVLSKADSEFLRMEPVAVQLEDGTVQGIRVLRSVDLETCSPLMMTAVENMLHTKDEIQHIVAAFHYMECWILMLNVPDWHHSINMVTREQTSGGTQSTSPSMTVEHGSVTVSPSTSSYNSGRSGGGTGDGGSGPTPITANQILIKLAHTDKVVAYDMPRHEAFKVPNGVDFPAFYRRDDRHVLCLSPTFSLEVQELTDAVSRLSKIRCGISRVGNELKTVTTTLTQAASPQTSAASMMAIFKTPGQADKKKDAWQCYHPQLNAKYTPSMKWIKEFGEVRQIKLFTWGAIITLAKVDSPFAIISIDHPEYKKAYGDRMTICVRNFPYNVFSRDDIDVTATPGLERVYLCCCAQIASTSVLPQTSRIDFEIAEQNKKYKLRLVHIDVPEGAPIGPSLGSLESLGLLATFDPKIGMYYQNTLCKQFCPRYTSPTIEVSRDKSTDTAVEDDDDNETTDDEL